MTKSEESDVNRHLLNACGLRKTTNWYQALEHLLRVDELSSIWLGKESTIQLAEILNKVGLPCDMNKDQTIIKLKSGARANYFEKVMERKFEQEVSCFERLKIKKD
ncbi:hypothetical protein GJU43_14990 [Flavobacterium sp. LC2016-23]|uniref:hypothetical protein n=1 Tax=Flavobacterium sp. LC2016-23 TaxID=2666330 RepID=UPI0012B08200|nr:hypothetical protein [Flavobacterium sp. LC2016-23]MRX40592.1 hypothetical protein [Flavobacterium sp. LC2016-23]